jgi:beta-xylosidase
VLKHNGEYYAYGTVPLVEVAVPVLHSRDLVNWRAGQSPHPAGQRFRGPLGAGGRLRQRHVLHVLLRGWGGGTGSLVARGHSPHPAGPVEDSGAMLMPDDPFAIDAYPFHDEDGR